VFLMLRINPRKVKRFEQAGFRVVRRSAERDAAIRAKHAAQVGEEQYLRFGEREDAEGNKRGHSGEPIFGFNKKGIPHEAIQLLNLHDDLQAAGYKLTRVEIIIKPKTEEAKQDMKPDMGVLVITYEPKGKKVKQVKLRKNQLQMLANELSRYFQFVHVWDNRDADGSAAVNPSHVVEEKDERKLTDPRLLRLQLLENGEPQWVNQPEEATASA
jgi:hypothetical protein